MVLIILLWAVLTLLLPLAFSEEVEKLFQEHWQYHVQSETAKEQGLHQVFKDWIIKAKVTHKSLVSKIGVANVLARTNGWNPGEWNWNTLEKFPPRRKRVREEEAPQVVQPHPVVLAATTNFGNKVGKMADLLVQMQAVMDGPSTPNPPPASTHRRVKRVKKQ